MPEDYEAAVAWEDAFLKEAIREHDQGAGVIPEPIAAFGGARIKRERHEAFAQPLSRILVGTIDLDSSPEKCRKRNPDVGEATRAGHTGGVAGAASSSADATAASIPLSRAANPSMQELFAAGVAAARGLENLPEDEDRLLDGL